MNKKWYTVTFSAQMTEDDVRAMKKCFYDAMEEAMEISPCAALDIKLEDNQYEEFEVTDDDCPLGGDISNDCEGCAYACDYHFVDGECIRREK